MNIEEKNEIAGRNFDLVYRICLTRLFRFDRCLADDASQEVFLYFAKKPPLFSDLTHEKAWFLRCAVNICNDFCRKAKRQDKSESLGIPEQIGKEDEYFAGGQVFSALSVLPPKICDVMHLFYVEGYGTDEAARILGVSGMAVRTRLKRGREILRKKYKNGFGEENDKEGAYV